MVSGGENYGAEEDDPDFKGRCLQSCHDGNKKTVEACMRAQGYED